MTKPLQVELFWQKRRFLPAVPKLKPFWPNHTVLSRFCQNKVISVKTHSFKQLLLKSSYFGQNHCFEQLFDQIKPSWPKTTALTSFCSNQAILTKPTVFSSFCQNKGILAKTNSFAQLLQFCAAFAVLSSFCLKRLCHHFKCYFKKPKDILIPVKGQK